MSFKEATPDEKERLLGREFRNIEVLDMEIEAGNISVRIVLEGRVLVLLGDPQEALRTHLGGDPDGYGH
jgi:hypothetical protein